MTGAGKNSTFRDILVGFLEEKNSKKPVTDSPAPLKQPVFPSQMSEIAFVFIDARSFIHTPQTKQYQRTTPVHPKPIPSRKPEKTLVFSRESLSTEGQTALDTLTRLGALDLDTDLTEALIKKAYRRLLKFYHPDHYPLELLPEERHKRGERFLELQRAYKTLDRALAGPRAGA